MTSAVKAPDYPDSIKYLLRKSGNLPFEVKIKLQFGTASASGLRDVVENRIYEFGAVGLRARFELCSARKRYYKLRFHFARLLRHKVD